MFHLFVKFNKLTMLWNKLTGAGLLTALDEKLKAADVSVEFHRYLAYHAFA